MKKFLPIAALALLTLSGCASDSVEMVDTQNDQGDAVAGLDYRDFDKAANNAIQGMLESGAVSHPKGGRYILMISDVTNDTMQRIDTDQLIKKIRVALLQSGKVVVTTAVGNDGPEDRASMGVRKNLRDNDEFEQSAAVQKGTLKMPDLSLSGKILQRNVKAGSKVQIEYYFQLSLTQIKTGLALWEGEYPIVKRARGDTATW